MPAAAFHPEFSGWKVIQAKAVGTSHLANDLPCQDAVDWRTLPCGLLAIALADGAGTAPLSAKGAALAVSQTLAALEIAPANQKPGAMDLWGEAIREAFQTARSALLREAEAADRPPSDYATTLLCLVAAKDGLVIGQVGDGAAVARTPLGDLYTLTQAQRGEYANETIFLTMPDAFEQGFFQAVELDLAGLAVMSDGLIRLALRLPGYTPHAPFFAPLWAFAARSGSKERSGEELAAFLSSERVCARTDDDKSLAIAVLPGFDFPAPAASPLLTDPPDEA